MKLRKLPKILDNRPIDACYRGEKVKELTGNELILKVNKKDGKSTRVVSEK